MRTRPAWLPLVFGFWLVPAGALGQKDPGPSPEGALRVPVSSGEAPQAAPPKGAGAPKKAPSLLSGPAPNTPPAEDVIWLTPDRKRGGYFWKGSGFRARISADGDLSFEDQRLGLKFISPLAARPNPYAVPSVQSKLAGRNPRPADVTEVVPRPEETFTGYETPYLADPREAGRRGKEVIDYGSNVPIVMVGASFDLTEELSRLGGEDPYRVDKARFAASTRDLRGRLTARARSRATREACGRLREQLTALAASPPGDPASFRRAVAALGSDLDAATEDGRLLRGYLDGISRAGQVDKAPLAQPWKDDDPRLCGLVAAPPKPTTPGGGGASGAAARP